MKKLIQSRFGRMVVHAAVCLWLVAHGVNHLTFHLHGIIREIKGV